METALHWKSLFENWPDSLPRKGMIVTSFQETIPFVDFLISDGIVLVERDKPDSLGGRKILVAYAAIACVKLTSTEELGHFQQLGFQKPF